MRGTLKILAACLLSVTSALQASDRAEEVRKQALASMVVTGDISIDEQGRVVSHRIDQVEKLPGGVVALFGKALPSWRFEPMVRDGIASPATSRMRVRLVARELENDEFEVKFQDADFPIREREQGTYASIRKVFRPSFPRSALSWGAGGAVYVLIKIGPVGRVEDAIVEQVNLTVYGDALLMQQLRKAFGEAALKAAKSSKFDPPRVGEYVGQSTALRIPYIFEIEGSKAADPPYGQWAVYIPGPRQLSPWRTSEDSGSPDLMAANDGSEPVDDVAKLSLLTKLDDMH